jgi:hypothetical protein
MVPYGHRAYHILLHPENNAVGSILHNDRTNGGLHANDNDVLGSCDGLGVYSPTLMLILPIRHGRDVGAQTSPRR